MKIYKYALLFILILSSCSKSENKSERPPLPIEVGSATTQDIPIYIDTIANIHSRNTIEIRSQISGYIEKIHFTQGQFVKKGDLLYTIDPRVYIALLRQAKAALEKDKSLLKLAEATVERYQPLLKQEYVSKLNYDTYVSNVETAKAQIEFDEAKVKEAEVNLSFCYIKSPIDGVVGNYNIDQGNYIGPQQTLPLTDVLQIDPMSVYFTITQSEFVQVRNAQKEGNFKLFTYLPQFPKNIREGEIYFFDNHVDTQTGAILVKGSIPNEDGYFWPGEFARVRLELKIERNAVVVPETSVQIGQKGNFVYVYREEDKNVEYRPVERGPLYEGKILIYKGINAGEKVVTNGQINLRPDAKVYIVDNNKG